MLSRGEHRLGGERRFRAARGRRRTRSKAEAGTETGTGIDGGRVRNDAGGAVAACAWEEESARIMMSPMVRDPSPLSVPVPVPVPVSSGAVALLGDLDFSPRLSFAFCSASNTIIAASHRSIPLAAAIANACLHASCVSPRTRRSAKRYAPREASRPEVPRRRR